MFIDCWKKTKELNLNRDCEFYFYHISEHQGNVNQGGTE